MPAATLQSLQQVREALRRAVGGNQALFSLVNTRLILRTGVDLGKVEPAKDRDPAAVDAVIQALHAMGYRHLPEV